MSESFHNRITEYTKTKIDYLRRLDKGHMSGYVLYRFEAHITPDYVFGDLREFAEYL